MEEQENNIETHIAEDHNIKLTQLEDEMKDSYVDYAMSVIVARALPDVRDGLKPVHRRILYTMLEEGITPDKKFRKSAATVGNVLARYHPHGDASVYDAMVRMAQPFNMRYPLVWPQGNFGSVDGDSAAHMRYTEAKLGRMSMDVMRDLRKDTVPWTPNFDNSTKEPFVLPTVIPTLLVNGSDGIAVGMATKIPPHNITEVINGCLAYVDNEDITISELMHHIPGPDFPTGAKILGTSGIRSAYNTGRGIITMRSVMNVEDLTRTQRAIVVTEIPYQVNKALLIERVVAKIKEKSIEGITGLRDESSRAGMRIVFELSRDAVPEVVMNQLYKHSDLQSSFGVIMLALVDGTPDHPGLPKVLNLKEVIGHFISHRRVVVTRRTQFELNKAQARAHIVEALLKALDYIDEIIALIKASANADIARTSLMERFQFTEVQAQAILDMRLQRLTGLEREKLESEYKELMALIDYLKGLLADVSKMNEVIKTELKDVQARYGDKRRTVIEPFIDKDFAIEDLIPDEPTVVTMSNTGYIKRVAFDKYKVQARGGRGKSGTSLKEEDSLEHFFVTRTHHFMLFFTNTGRIFKLRIHQIPDLGRSAKGTPVVNLLQLQAGEKVAAVIPIVSDKEHGCIITATKCGIVKRTSLQQYAKIRAKGMHAVKLRDGDELVSVAFSRSEAEDTLAEEEKLLENEEVDTEEVIQDEISEDTEEPEEVEEIETIEEEPENSDDVSNCIVLVTRSGKLIRFKESKLRVMGRAAAGVKGIKLSFGDSVVAMDMDQYGSQVLFITENGFGKRTTVNSYRIQNRGGKGLIGIRLADKSGYVVAARIINPEDEVMVSTLKGTLIRTKVEGISQNGPYATGVLIIRTSDGDYVSGLARVIPEDYAEKLVEAEPESVDSKETTEETGDVSSSFESLATELGDPFEDDDASERSTTDDEDTDI